MRFALLPAIVLAVFALSAMPALAQSPSPAPPIATAPPATPTTTPPVTSVPQFPSSPHYLRAWPGPEEDSWYVYASGFTPRTSWLLVEVLCSSLPCEDFGASTNGNVTEEGTLSFYIQLPRAANPAAPRLLAAIPDPAPEGGVSAGAPALSVAGHNPGGGLGYPRGTRTGIAAVDEVIALAESLDTAGIRSRLVLKTATNFAGEEVRGVASWQCTPYVRAEADLGENFEYPAALVYAVFRVPDWPALPLRYEGATYGIAWYDGGVGLPLGGLILVSESGQVVGTEIRCGTTPGFHVHNFTDFILAPFTGPAPATVTPAPPKVGLGPGPEEQPGHGAGLLALALVLMVSGGAATFVALPRNTRSRDG